MGKKRKSPKSGRAQQQQSFQQTITDQTLKKFKPYIDQQLQGAARAIAMQQSQLLDSAFTRIRILEELLIEKHEDVSKIFLANRVAELEDQKNGLVVADEVVIGDRVRLEIRAKELDGEYKESTKLLVDNAGTGQTLGAALEDALVGMKTDEIKEITYGAGQKMTAELTINRVSRAPVAVKAEETVSAEECTNADSNEG